MHRLQVFTWSCMYLPGQQRPTSHPKHENAVLTVVSRLPALQNLHLSGKFAFHALSSQFDTSSMTYPVSPMGYHSLSPTRSHTILGLESC
jgi:hypothetical protein